MPNVSYTRLEKEFLALYKPPLRRKSTYFKLRRVMQEFRDLPGIKTARDITPSKIAEWVLAHADRAPMTNRSYLGAFRPAVNYGLKMGYLRVNPWDIRTDWITFDFDEEDEPDEARHYSLEELVRLMDQLDLEAQSGRWTDLRLQALVYTFAHTGLRTMEGLGLKVDDVVLARGLIRIRSRRKRKMKTRTSARTVGIPDELQAILERWIPLAGSEWLFPGVRKKGPWFYGGPGGKPLDQLKAVAGRAGIDYATIHMFRRSIATHADRLGITKAEVSRMLGHGIQTQAEWYIEDDAADIRDVASRISYRSHLSTTRQRPSPAGPSPLPCPGVAV